MRRDKARIAEMRGLFDEAAMASISGNKRPAVQTHLTGRCPPLGSLSRSRNAITALLAIEDRPAGFAAAESVLKQVLSVARDHVGVV